MTEEQAKPEMQEEKLEQLDLEQPSTETEAASADQTVEQAMEVLSTEQKLSKELEELNDKYLRLLAEFDNFRRRTAKERIN